MTKIDDLERRVAALEQMFADAEPVLCRILDDLATPAAANLQSGEVSVPKEWGFNGMVADARSMHSVITDEKGANGWMMRRRRCGMSAKGIAALPCFTSSTWRHSPPSPII